MNFFLESNFTYGTSTTIIVNVLFWGGIFVVYSLRKIPPFAAIWNVVLLFLIVLFGTVFFNNIKDKFKDFLK